ncbi:hypothetical protein DL98DRAFT_5029 [Cadophora sp. DSE1049]|nr:hypothetical protein DL98DRAFT_5029 [Cadophora sp. DSE1049]
MMSSANILPAKSSKAAQFPLRSIAPLPVRIKRDPAWARVNGALGYVAFERKRKACFDAADALKVSANKHRRIEDRVCERVDILLSVSTGVEPLPVLVKSEAIAEAMPVSAVVEPAAAIIKSEAVKSKSASNLISTTQSTTFTTQSATRGHPMIKCRVTGYPRLRQKMDDFEAMWDAKDEQRWESWCEKSREERCPVEGYEEGDSDCEWEEFKAKRR